MVAFWRQIDHRCPCGRDLRHRGSCQFRRTYRAEEEKANDSNQTAELSENGRVRAREAATD
jgi:hypothetical protein